MTLPAVRTGSEQGRWVADKLIKIQARHFPLVGLAAFLSLHLVSLNVDNLERTRDLRVDLLWEKGRERGEGNTLGLQGREQHSIDQPTFRARASASLAWAASAFFGILASPAADSIPVAAGPVSEAVAGAFFLFRRRRLAPSF